VIVSTVPLTFSIQPTAYLHHVCTLEGVKKLKLHLDRKANVELCQECKYTSTPRCISFSNSGSWLNLSYCQLSKAALIGAILKNY